MLTTFLYGDVPLSTLHAILVVLTLLYAISSGIGNVVKFKIGYLLGKGKIVEARNAGNFYKAFVLIFGAILSVFLVWFCWSIAYLVTQDDFVSLKIDNILLYLSFTCVLWMYLGVLNSLMRVYGYVSSLSFSYVLFIASLGVILGCQIFIGKFDFGLHVLSHSIVCVIFTFLVEFLFWSHNLEANPIENNQLDLLAGIENDELD